MFLRKKPAQKKGQIGDNKVTGDLCGDEWLQPRGVSTDFYFTHLGHPGCAWDGLGLVVSYLNTVLTSH